MQFAVRDQTDAIRNKGHMIDIQQNLAEVKSRIEEHIARYHRQSHSVSLLAVTKTQSIEAIQQAIHAGQFAFGENHLQEALTKINYFTHQAMALEWHFLGLIQSNKTRKIAENFSWVHSVDSIKIAERLNDQRPTHLPPLNICLQINISQEPSKSGILPQHIDSLATFCQNLPKLKLRGLMAIPAVKKTLMEQRTELAKLKSLYDKLRENNFALDTLSMGMSDDLEAAIAEGSTLIRIGTAIFGSR